MDSQTRQSFLFSLLLHGAFVGIGFLFFLLQDWFDKPEPVVFELVAAAAAPAVQETPADPRQDPAPQPLAVKPAEPLKPVPKLPDLPKPEPEPQLTYEEWVRNRKLPDRVQRVQTPAPRPAQPVPEIETSVRERLERQLSPIRLQGADTSSVRDSDALQRYLADLRRRIQESFEPTGARLQAEVYFTVTAQGRILDARIHQSSGDAAFDRSVLRTFQTARTPGPPPGNRDYAFSLLFRGE